MIIQTTAIGTELFDVMATDGDQQGTINSDLTFELIDSSLPFAIGETSGVITVNGTLQAITYEIAVQVNDRGMPTLSSNGTFTLEVAPANDAAPKFEEPFEFNIIENTSPTDPVFKFNVSDDDTGNEARINLTLSDTEYSQNFSLEFTELTATSVEGQLYLLDEFDRESITNFTITVEATDTGYEDFRKTNSQVFTVNVQDANDNSPVFTNLPYTNRVAEDRTDGYIFFQVSATDSDIGINAELEFSLDDDFNGTFGINSSSGELSIEGVLHKATQDQYLLNILVTDGGDPSLNDTTTLNVTIDEVNDNSPYFIEPSEARTITLPEDVETGYVLLNVSASDDDTGLAGEVELSINPVDSPFIIENGSLVLDSALNYEVIKIGIISLRVYNYTCFF